MIIMEKSLVLYKNRAAVVTGIGEKLSISLAGGDSLKVREKDVDFLHPGPAAKPANIEAAEPAGDVQGAWELLQGSTVPLQELAELAYGEWTPESAWAAWRLVMDGLLFSGTTGAIRARNADEVAADRAKRDEKGRESAEKAAFLERLVKGKLSLPEDSRRLQDVEALALGKTDKSKTLKEAGKEETPQQAHRILLECAYWKSDFNPYPSRFGKALVSAKEPIPPPPTEDRLDLRSMRAFAIDNAWSHDPDDAVSFDGQAYWVHVADPAASIPSGSACDLEARGLGETLYLPEGTYRMLAEESLPAYALGLTESSPALSFRVTLNEDASFDAVDIFKTTVRVERLTYAQADEQAASSELAPLFAIADRLYARRLEAGAVVIDLPETHMIVREGAVHIDVIPTSRAAEMVREFMLLAGNAAAKWALRNRVPFPFVAQETGDLPSEPLPGLAGSYQLRRCMRPRRLSSVPGSHGGLGLPEYTQVTSPLRRYTDLVAHQQIRAFLDGRIPLPAEEVLAVLAAGEAAAQAAVQAERASRSHWTMVLLSDMKDSVWDATVVDRKGGRAVVLIPSLALETSVAIKGDPALNDTIQVALAQVKIPELEASFKAV